MRKAMEGIFHDHGLVVHDKSTTVPQYFLRYDAPRDARSTIKIDVTFPSPKANEYQPLQIPEIGRSVMCQSRETWFANKLVAFIERYEHRESIAGRDLYDIHQFFLHGFRYHAPVIAERRRTTIKNFFKKLVDFTDRKVTQTVIDQDLNTLLPSETFRRVRKLIKRETLMFLRDELMRIEKI